MTEHFRPFDYEKSFSEQADILLSQQILEWPELKTGCDFLKSTEEASLPVGEFRFKKLLNSNRMTNIKADVGSQAMPQRRCFLCPDNLPPEQRGLELDDFLLLCNPRPIFERHFTLASREHKEQEMDIDRLITTAKLIGSNFTIFFNGAKAGASAPDHLHFQICPLASLPLMHQISHMDLRSPRVINVLDAGYVLLRDASPEKLQGCLLVLMKASQETLNRGTESLNILAHFSQNQWTLVFVPRRKHRPALFERSGDKQLLLSPAAVETAGAIVTSRRSDFDRIDCQLLREIWQELYFSQAEASKLLEGL
jgi:hypothetical protein